MAEITNFRGDTQPVEQLSSIDRAVQQLIVRVGDRVRKARERKGIPRRVLSERSGVSPRYLAQLEAGAGNISIGLLERVAIALDHRIEWFVGEEDPWTSDSVKVATLFQSADRATQQAVLGMLGPSEPGLQKAHRICLLGLRGAGKSTLGRAAGEKLDLPFLELNREIEDHSGMPVSEVMALYGQEGYRKLESQALQRVIATHDSVILAVAGGIVAEPMTYNTLLSNFHTVWVKASPEEHMNRVQAQGDDRPMAGNPEAMEQLRSLLVSREALYDRAEARLDTTGRNFEQSLGDLLALIESEGFLG
ncbi:helix-turn-helix transcriptional regulator [Shimia aestuarii]|uniref:Shikimate kinase n=1 Tax=Shimia aestuarii TaxID=254406 RepID=A0A1I4JQP8_9RHOB|nr:helix-turn-helix transcriptional regulator [Shimia aestuarii]SFL68850.1 transcriptional regulator, XRE family with shikimate kinase activity [Shimia aestuarii]